jgi:hypothetical protein
MHARGGLLHANDVPKPLNSQKVRLNLALQMSISQTQAVTCFTYKLAPDSKIRAAAIDSNCGTDAPDHLAFNAMLEESLPVAPSSACRITSSRAK